MGYVPMGLIGFMGRHDSTSKEDGIGSALIIDAARRLHRSADFAAWGLMLDSETGPGTKLWDWYLSTGFIAAKDQDRATMMYGPLAKFLPELHTAS